jgi:hypothetical protein
MKNEVILDFIISDFDEFSHDHITQYLGITPIKIYIKREKKNPKFAGTAKRNRWIMGAGIDKYATFKDQMNSLLDIIELKNDLFRPLCEKYYCEFSCAIFIPYNDPPNQLIYENI